MKHGTFFPLLKKKKHEDLAAIVPCASLFAGRECSGAGSWRQSCFHRSSCRERGAAEQTHAGRWRSFPFKSAYHKRTATPKPEYSAEVEEYWVSPDKWRRTVQSAGFSQTLIVNGDKVSEKLIGDYYPFWLHDLVTALFDPLPMADQLKADAGTTGDPGRFRQIKLLREHASKVGIAPAQNTLGMAFCFGGKGGLLQAVVTPGYKAQFDDYLPFKKKMVARTIQAEFAPGLVIDGKGYRTCQSSPARMKSYSPLTSRRPVHGADEDHSGDGKFRPGFGPEYATHRVANGARRKD